VALLLEDVDVELEPPMAEIPKDEHHKQLDRFLKVSRRHRLKQTSEQQSFPTPSSLMPVCLPHQTQSLSATITHKYEDSVRHDVH